MHGDDVGRRTRRSQKPEEIKANERFRDLIKVVIGRGSTLNFALLCRVSEAAVRNWIEGSSPSKSKRQEVLEWLKLDSDILEVEDSKWIQFIADIVSGRVLLPTIIQKPDWLYTDYVRAAEQHISPEHHIILITQDAYNDTQRGEIQDVVRSNLRRGVSYTYVIPHTCPNRLNLVRLIEYLRRDIRGLQNAGTVDIMIVTENPKNTSDWKWIDHTMFFLNRKLTSRESIGEIDLFMIASGQEQIYKADDHVGTMQGGILEYVWIKTPRRKELLYIELLKEWAGTSEWI